jgi:peptidoglycan-associated lipoprotein
MNRQLITISGLAILLAVGCAKKPLVKPPEVIPPSPEIVKSTEAPSEPEIRYPDWQNIPELATIYFDFDRAEITPEARDILQDNAQFLAKSTEVVVLIEGHCDERGTIEYNLGLGQRRAKVVRDYYIALGVPAEIIGTISYGKEKPIDPGHTEQAWMKNRRAETKVRTKTK